ncbi:hypothetical protein BV898_15320 [Hypsibius exemplaris]|uniref:MARVEL domain-containing protein n=1 Tax=Hypsibius exemplaris TaxID=2072580 RepID=A0A9X6NK10_HYPEX|nr:hypothetical protein BV898_15320 [Hypsibius exemplaris]
MGVIFSIPSNDPAATATSHQDINNHPGVRCNPAYLRTVPGILKILEIGFSLLAVIMSHSGYYSSKFSHGSVGWANFAAGTACINATLWLVVILCNLRPWLLYQMAMNFLMASILLIAGAVMIPYSNVDGARAACVVFSWAAMVCFLVDGLMKVNFQPSAAARGEIGEAAGPVAKV